MSASGIQIGGPVAADELTKQSHKLFSEILQAIEQGGRFRQKNNEERVNDIHMTFGPYERAFKQLPRVWTLDKNENAYRSKNKRTDDVAWIVKSNNDPGNRDHHCDPDKAE